MGYYVYQGEIAADRNIPGAEDLLKAFCSFATFGAREVLKHNPFTAVITFSVIILPTMLCYVPLYLLPGALSSHQAGLQWAE